MALLCERRSGRLSTFPAGTLVTNQTNPGSASPVAVTAGEGLRPSSRVWCCGCTVLPPLTFFLYESPANGFKEEAALLMVCCQVPQSSGKCRPLKMADVASTEGLFE